MKIILFASILLSAHIVSAQVSSVEMRGDFADLAKLGKVQLSEGLQNYSSNNVNGSRYLTENWETGSLITFSGETISAKFVFMFDKQDHNVYIKPKDSAVILLADKHQIRQFTIKKRTFVNGKTMSGGDPELFYELLGGKETGYCLYKLTKTKFIKANKQDAERIKTGNFDDEYKDQVTYFLKTPDQPAVQKIKLGESNLLKAIPGESKKIKSFFNDHLNDNENDENLMGQLIDSLN